MKFVNSEITLTTKLRYLPIIFIFSSATDAGSWNKIHKNDWIYNCQWIERDDIGWADLNSFARLPLTGESVAKGCFVQLFLTSLKWNRRLVSVCIIQSTCLVALLHVGLSSRKYLPGKLWFSPYFRKLLYYYFTGFKKTANKGLRKTKYLSYCDLNIVPKI